MPLPRDFEERCWCDARALWFTACYQDYKNYLCDDHKREAEAMPENEGVEFHAIRQGRADEAATRGDSK